MLSTKMSLYDSILEFEKLNAKAILYESGRGNPLFEKITASLDEKIVETQVNKLRLLLDTAYYLKGSQITEERLDSLVEEWGNLDEEVIGRFFELFPNHFKEEKRVVAAKKDRIKASIEFYQQLISQGSADDFRDAVRNKFRNREAYLNALKPLDEAHERYEEVSIQCMPKLVAKIFRENLPVRKRAKEKVREVTLRSIFPEEY